ncbi:DUF2845 domain-containing protein [Halopseudomonas sp.]|uniref:DUF2845 domain-containing protein n=1 Tax=Halopseudomonas sp. TaxID=2901191 RepID=UPI0030038921
MNRLLKRFTALGAATVMTLLCTHLHAAMRCAGGLVDEGDSIDQVLQQCGEPDQREATPQYIEADGFPADGSVNEEDWVYGPDNGMYRYLHFIDGKLVRLRSQRN